MVERKLSIVPTKSTEEEINDIQLSMFDIIVHTEEDSTWFQEALKQLEDTKIN